MLVCVLRFFFKHYCSVVPCLLCRTFAWHTKVASFYLLTIRCLLQDSSDCTNCYCPYQGLFCLALHQGFLFSVVCWTIAHPRLLVLHISGRRNTMPSYLLQGWSSYSLLHIVHVDSIMIEVQCQLQELCSVQIVLLIVLRILLTISHVVLLNDCSSP